MQEIIQQEEVLDQVAELKGRRTTMEIRNVRCGDKIFKREIVHRPDAVCAIVRAGQSCLFVKQFRVPVGEELLEAVAGCVDEGEIAEHAILREVQEETGYEPFYFMKLGKVKASPGYSDETIHLYYVRVKDVAGEQRPDDDERVIVCRFSREEVDSMVNAGKITDAKTLLAWYEYKRQEWA